MYWKVKADIAHGTGVTNTHFRSGGVNNYQQVHKVMCE